MIGVFDFGLGVLSVLAVLVDTQGSAVHITGPAHWKARIGGIPARWLDRLNSRTGTFSQSTLETEEIRHRFFRRLRLCSLSGPSRSGIADGQANLSVTHTSRATSGVHVPNNQGLVAATTYCWALGGVQDCLCSEDFMSGDHAKDRIYYRALAGDIAEEAGAAASIARIRSKQEHPSTSFQPIDESIVSNA